MPGSLAVFFYYPYSLFFGFVLCFGTEAEALNESRAAES